jgi:hypothetical protein
MRRQHGVATLRFGPGGDDPGHANLARPGQFDIAQHAQGRDRQQQRLDLRSRKARRRQGGIPGQPVADTRLAVDQRPGGTQRGTIILYLTDMFTAAGLGPLPAGPQRGRYLSWLSQDQGGFKPVILRTTTASRIRTCWTRPATATPRSGNWTMCFHDRRPAGRRLFGGGSADRLAPHVVRGGAGTDRRRRGLDQANSGPAIYAPAGCIGRPSRTYAGNTGHLHHQDASRDDQRPQHVRGAKALAQKRRGHDHAKDR